jgi:hypothetical protein
MINTKGFDYVTLSIGCGDGQEFSFLYKPNMSNMIIGIEPDNAFYQKAIATARELEERLVGSRVIVTHDKPTVNFGFKSELDIIKIIFPFGDSFEALNANDSYMTRLLSYLKRGGQLELVLHNPPGFEFYDQTEYFRIFANAESIELKGLAYLYRTQASVNNYPTTWASKLTFQGMLPATADIIRLIKR